MSRFRGEVLDWLDAERATPGRERELLRAADVTPSPAAWREFLGHLTLWLGTIALAAAVIFFFAFNWDDLDRFAKFGLVEAAILAGLLACWRVDLDGAAGKAVLVMLSLLTGALLALSGQIYQTGADTYELFAWWAVADPALGAGEPLQPACGWSGWLCSTSPLFPIFRSSEPRTRCSGPCSASTASRWSCGKRRIARALAWLRDSWPPRLIAIARRILGDGAGHLGDLRNR